MEGRSALPGVRFDPTPSESEVVLDTSDICIAFAELPECNEPYQWVVGAFSPCSATCGPMGVQSRAVSCVSSPAMQPAPDQNCIEHVRSRASVVVDAARTRDPDRYPLSRTALPSFRKPPTTRGCVITPCDDTLSSYLLALELIRCTDRVPECVTDRARARTSFASSRSTNVFVDGVSLGARGAPLKGVIPGSFALFEKLVDVDLSNQGLDGRVWDASTMTELVFM